MTQPGPWSSKRSRFEANLFPRKDEARRDEDLDSWVGRCILDGPSPWHPLSLPWYQMRPRPGVPHEP